MEASSTTGDVMEIESGSSRASSATNHKEAIMLCCICRNSVTSKKAKLLPCLHTLCSPCEITAMTEGKMTCRFCNQSCDATQITDNFLVQYLDVGTEQIKCDSCTDNATAKYRCDDCHEHLCVECGRAHQRVKVTKDHQLKEIDVGGSGDSKCSTHTDEDLSWYCVTCEEVTCRNCQLEKHAGHQYRSFEEHSQIYRDRMTFILNENRKHITTLCQIINLADQRIREVNVSEKAMRSELHEAIKQIHQALTDRGNFLLNKIKTSSEAKRRSYQDVRIAAENIDSLSKQVNFFIEAALECNNRLALRRSTDMVETSLKKIENLRKERRSAVNELQMQVQLSLNISQFNEIVGLLQKVGELIVDRPSPNVLNLPPTSQQQIQSTSSSVHPLVAQGMNVNHTYVSVANQIPQQQLQLTSPGSYPVNRPQQQSHTSQRGGATVVHRHLNPQQQHQQSQPASGPMPIPQPQAQQQVQVGAYTVPYHPINQNGQNMFVPNSNAYLQRALGAPVRTNYTRMPMQTSPVPVNMIPANQVHMVNSSQPLSHLQQLVQLDANQQQSSNYYQHQQSAPPPPYVVAANFPGQSVHAMPPTSSAVAGHNTHVTSPHPNNNQIRPNMRVTPPNVVTANRVRVQSPQSNVIPQQSTMNEQQLRMQQPPTNHSYMALPRLQYGPRMTNASRLPPVPMQQPVQIQAANIQSAVQVQRVPYPVLLSNAPPPLQLSSNEMPNSTMQNNLNLSRKRKSSGDTNTGSNIKSLSPRLVNQVQIIQLSPTPEESQAKSDADKLVEEVTERNLIITNVISVNNQNNKNGERIHNSEPAADVSATPPATAETAHDAAAEPVKTPEGAAEGNATTESNFSVPPARISRMARKSIAKLSDANLQEKNVIEELKEELRLECDALNSKTPDGEIEKTSESKPPSYLDHFPMTQAFVPNVDEDEFPSFVNDMSPQKTAIIPLVAQQFSSTSVISNGSRGDVRTTPDAGEVTTSGVDDNRWNDYCSVCQNGGDLMCCEAKDCPRVFHCYDHIPQYLEVPKDKWICTLCIDPNEYKSSEDKIPAQQRNPFHLSPFELKCCERILLELYCHPESEPFHNPVGEIFIDYYQTIQHPMDFSVIRKKLKQSAENKYVFVEDFLNDLNRVFTNCAIYNDKESDIGKAGRIIGAKYKDLINEYFPTLVHLVETSKSKKSSGGEKRKRRRLELASDSDDSSKSNGRSGASNVKNK